MKCRIIDRELINSTVEKAQGNSRKRMNENFHVNFADPINRMLNAMEPGTYVRPHKHENPDKREVFIILQGSLLIIFFNNDGSIKDHVILNHKNGVFGVEIPEKEWHTVVSLESGSVMYEIKDGPYEPLDDKNFASWAPAEGSPECSAYIQSLLKKLDIKI